MSGITCKFGGSSLADTDAFKTAKAIIDNNPERRFIVPSAPGKRSPDDKKVTDLLLAWHRLVQEGLDPSEPRTIITERYKGLAADLGLSLDVNAQIEALAAQEADQDRPDFMASRGEFLCGHLIAELIDATFVDPAECIRFDNEGRPDLATYELLGERLQGPDRFVVPGSIIFKVT